MNDEGILDAFLDADEPLTTPEVATRIGISKPAAWKRLTNLVERDLVEKHAGGGLRDVSWSLSDDGRAYLEDELVA